MLKVARALAVPIDNYAPAVPFKDGMVTWENKTVVTSGVGELWNLSVDKGKLNGKDVYVMAYVGCALDFNSCRAAWSVLCNSCCHNYPPQVRAAGALAHCLLQCRHPAGTCVRVMLFYPTSATECAGTCRDLV